MADAASACTSFSFMKNGEESALAKMGKKSVPRMRRKASSGPAQHWAHGIGYPYCLGKFAGPKFGKGPFDLLPHNSWEDFGNHRPMCMWMPHEFYCDFTKHCLRRLQWWWECELIKGTTSLDPRAEHNCPGSIPEYLQFSMSWVCHRDARCWTPAGFRWMLHQMFGDLHAGRRDRMEKFFRAPIKRKLEMFGDMYLSPVFSGPRQPLDRILRTSVPVCRGPHHPVMEVLRSELPDAGVASMFLPSRHMLDMFHC